MTEQLYKMVQPPENASDHEMGVYQDGKFAGVLVPVPAPRTLAWALGEMYANPLKEYRRGPDCGERWRWNSDCKQIQLSFGGDWLDDFTIEAEDIESASWSPCEAESPDEEIPMVVNMEPKPAIVPGTLEWAREVVKGGGKIWYETAPKLAFDCDDTGLMHAPNGWRLWGTREWLASLPDGAEVVNKHRIVWRKEGSDVCRTVQGHLMRTPIAECADDGWRLATSDDVQPHAEPTLEQRVERLERMMDTNYGPVKP